jgi:hypothetical protein
VKGKRKHEPAWHQPLGNSSVRKLAEVVGRLNEYEIFYTQMSETMHSSWYKEHITIQKGKIELEPIRHLEEAASSINLMVSMVLHSYKKVLAAYRPGQLTEFVARYAGEWRKPFLNVRQVKYSARTTEAF